MKVTDHQIKICYDLLFGYKEVSLVEIHANRINKN